MSISAWPVSQRPREKLLRSGAAALSDAELLALMLRCGTRNESALGVAQRMLAQFGTLNAIFSAELRSFTAIGGIGPAKYCELQAVFELARRALAEKMTANVALSSPQAVHDYLILSLGPKPYEVFMSLYVDAQNRLIAADESFRGTLTQTSVYPREIARRALALNAASLIVAHNHPSGCCTPSAADSWLTLQLKAALELLDVKLLDHLVVAANGVYSFAEHGQL